jgi:hypothetical protein
MMQKSADLTMFVGGILLIGGILSVLIPTAQLGLRSLAPVIAGISQLILGTSFLYRAIVQRREKWKGPVNKGVSE